MNTKTLKTIQVLSKIGRILSKTAFVCCIVYAIFRATMEGVGEYSFGEFGSAAIGVMFILTSLICRYGAELTNPNVTEVADVKEVHADPFDEEKK